MSEVKGIDDHFPLKTLRFFMRFVGMWPVDNSRDQFISDLLLVFIFATVVLAMMIEGWDFYVSWGDLHVCQLFIFNKLNSIEIYRGKDANLE